VKLSELKPLPCNWRRGKNFEHFCINCWCLTPWYSSWLLLFFQAQDVETADKQGVLQVHKLQLLSLPHTIHHHTNSSPPHKHLSILHPICLSATISYQFLVLQTHALINIQQPEQMSWFWVTWVLVCLGFPLDKILTAFNRGLSFVFQHILTSQWWLQLVFAGSVLWPQKIHRTELNQTMVRSIFRLRLPKFGVILVASCLISKIIQNCSKTGWNQLQPVKRSRALHSLITTFITFNLIFGSSKMVKNWER